MQAFADGKVGDILFTSAKIAFANAVNFLAGTLMVVAQALFPFPFWNDGVVSPQDVFRPFGDVIRAGFEFFQFAIEGRCHGLLG